MRVWFSVRITQRFRNQSFEKRLKHQQAVCLGRLNLTGANSHWICDALLHKNLIYASDTSRKKCSAQAKFIHSKNSYERQRAAGSFSRHAVGQQ